MDDNQEPTNPVLKGCAVLFLAFPVFILIFFYLLFGLPQIPKNNSKTPISPESALELKGE